MHEVTLLATVTDGLLAGLKLSVGVLASSQALIADGIHSLSDLVTDLGVLVTARLAGQAPDQQHPYGHGRFETLGTLALGAVLLLVAGGLAQDSIARLLHADVVVPGVAALLVALLSILAKEWLYRRTRKVAQATDSQLLQANAWHSRSDALSSVAVLIGVGGAMAGWPWLDLLAALVVTAMIAWIGWKLLAQSAWELVDSGLPAAELAAIRSTVCGISGVQDVGRVRSRSMGPDILLDLDILVAPELSVSEGHQLAWQVQQALKRSFPRLRTVQVHVDADRSPPSRSWPPPEQVRAALRQHWQPLLPQSWPRMVLHYRPEGIRVELFLPALEDGNLLSASEQRALQQHLAAAASVEPWFEQVRIWWSPLSEASNRVG